MKIVEKNKEKRKFELKDIVKSNGIYYMIVENNGCYDFLSLQTGRLQENQYSTIEEMMEDNNEDIFVDAELHIL